MASKPTKLVIAMQTDVSLVVYKGSMLQKQLEGLGIETIEQLLNYSWGYFKILYNIGDRVQSKLETRLRKVLHIDINKFLMQLPANTPVPAKLQQICLPETVKTKSDLKFMSISAMAYVASFDLSLCRRFLLMIESMDARLLDDDDVLLYELDDLSNIAKSALYQGKIYTKKSLLTVRIDDAFYIPGLNKNVRAELRAWQEAQVLKSAVNQ